MVYPVSTRRGFLDELAALLASHHIDRETGTDEDSIALYLGKCLDAYHWAVQTRDRAMKTEGLIDD